MNITTTKIRNRLIENILVVTSGKREGWRGKNGRLPRYLWKPNLGSLLIPKLNKTFCELSLFIHSIICRESISFSKPLIMIHLKLFILNRLLFEKVLDLMPIIINSDTSLAFLVLVVCVFPFLIFTTLAKFYSLFKDPDLISLIFSIIFPFLISLISPLIFTGSISFLSFTLGSYCFSFSSFLTFVSWITFKSSFLNVMV